MYYSSLRIENVSNQNWFDIKKIRENTNNMFCLIAKQIQGSIYTINKLQLTVVRCCQIYISLSFEKMYTIGQHCMWRLGTTLHLRILNFIGFKITQIPVKPYGIPHFTIPRNRRRVNYLSKGYCTQKFCLGSGALSIPDISDDTRSTKPVYKQLNSRRRINIQ